ncbi:50S ribosomal protein L28 [candidate division WOR-1 bacterium RIFOXYC2_FULL_37_10]|uniref:Large ribosomal subunit protein bL28 n=1 Tax=candidate division WOR-1 bacterium RIFOXYB2_FULL_37_13 TaxID=1802579 RepID=A0A1F4SE07_UNCSA|nr:MAG: 50S ribosomal protein L28 [candidate division WOR-1 bacterium RIFOXYA2_FULL_37_7]OGC18654.1 MAG: 50S ribosomal protein L28 [candidate division WOR-1 bacterium RIFOXYB2_FULL_37_13]OGC32441.1 MAG: 50S ribosomal protein L28 [candidate division WOR-1 bacterium RIFOXYC2_FULL_37_10]
MAKQCYICDKKPAAGNNVSHSNKKTKRRWLPNLQKIWISVSGKKIHKTVCTKCIKAGKIKKAA